MIKRFLTLASSTALLAGTAFAGGVVPAPTHNPYQGLALGAGIGVSHFHVQQVINDSGTTVLRANLGRYNAVFAAELGYGQVFANQYYVGALATYQYSGSNNITTDYANIVLMSNYRTTNAYGALLRLGYVTDSFFRFYIEAGAQWTQFRFSLNDVGNSTYNENKTSIGFVWGLGLDCLLAKQLTLGLEYKKTYLSNYKKDLNATSFPDANGLEATQDLSAFLVKLSYTFQV